MSAVLTTEELDIAALLMQKGMSRGAATLAVVMATREHSRPETELADIVRQYQGLEEARDSQGAIRELKQIGWIIAYDTYGITLLSQAKDLRKRIAAKLGDDNVKDALKRIRSSQDPYVTIRGDMKDEDVYLTYLKLIESATKEICLPMLATTPKLESVPAIKERASKGVKVRILLGSPDFVVQLRGETMRSTATDAIAGWTAIAATVPNIEVRIAHTLEDCYLSTCMLIDRNLLRLDVYDPHRQRSLQGVMVEFHAQDGLDLNVVRVFGQRFDEAWERAKPTLWLPYLVWCFGNHWQLFMGLLFVLFAFCVSSPVSSGIFGSIAATFFANELIRYWSHIKKRISR